MNTYKKELGKLSHEELLKRIYELNLLKKNIKENNMRINIEILRNPNNTFTLIGNTF